MPTYEYRCSDLAFGSDAAGAFASGVGVDAAALALPLVRLSVA